MFDKSFPRYTDFDPLVPVWCVTPNRPGCIHRFFNSSPISPSGRFLAVLQLPVEDRNNCSKSYLLAQLTVLVSGRTAEELFIHDITVGAENDLLHATEIARRMVTRCGMSDLGLASYRGAGSDQPFLGYELSQGRDYSEAMAAEIDRAVAALLTSRHQVARSILQSEEEAVRRLVDLLLEEETVSSAQIGEVLGRPSQAGQPVRLGKAGLASAC